MNLDELIEILTVIRDGELSRGEDEPVEIMWPNDDRNARLTLDLNYYMTEIGTIQTMLHVGIQGWNGEKIA